MDKLRIDCMTHLLIIHKLDPELLIASISIEEANTRITVADEDLDLAIALSLCEPRPESPIFPEIEDELIMSHTIQQSSPSSSSTSTSKPEPIVVPVPVKRVRALFNFKAPDPGDLSFSKGDIIDVVGAVYKAWWMGTINGRTGLFPTNYVVTLDDTAIPSVSTPEKTKRKENRVADEECCICFEEKPDYCLVPCGHSGICGSCVGKMERCPFCKTKVDGGMKLFKP